MDNDEDARIDRTGTLLACIRNAVTRNYKDSGLMQKAISERTGIKPSADKQKNERFSHAFTCERLDSLRNHRYTIVSNG